MKGEKIWETSWTFCPVPLVVVVSDVETTHCLIFKQDRVSIKDICAEVKKFVSFPFWKFQEPKHLSRIGFIQSPNDEILISQKNKLIASKLDSPKPKKFKEMMDKNERIYLTIVQHSRQDLSLAALTTSLSRHRWKYSFKENQPVSWTNQYENNDWRRPTTRKYSPHVPPFKSS